jgi:GxxExxY protein
MNEADLNALSRNIIDAACRPHATGSRSAGGKLLRLSHYELRKRGMSVQTEVSVPVVYDGCKLLDVGYRIDMLVEVELIVEIKAIEAIAPVHRAQLLGYLRHSGKRLGLLLNFNVTSLRDGIVRQVNRL